MALPAPNLDDRRFQDLVDDAKRMVQRRLSRVDGPQRVRSGRDADRDVRLHDRPAALPAQPGARPAAREVPGPDRPAACCRPRPARAQVTFWLSAPGAHATDDPVRHAGRHRAHGDRPLDPVLHRGRTCTAVPCSLRVRADRPAPGRDRASRTRTNWPAQPSSPAFADQPASRRPPAGRAEHGRAGLRRAAGLRRDSVHGIGVNPMHPPLVWEAWTAIRWTAVPGHRWTRPAASTGRAVSC